MTYHEPFNVLHSDEVYITLTVMNDESDEPFLNSYLIGHAQSMSWKFAWDTKVYRAIGDPAMGSDVFRNRLGAEGVLNSVILKRHRDVPFDFIDIGAKLILGQYEYGGFGKKPSFGLRQTFLPFTEIELVIWAVDINRGYKFNRIVPISAEGGIKQGEFASDVFKFISLDVSDIQGGGVPAKGSPIVAYGQDGSH
jgi:hypothetical protein